MKNRVLLTQSYNRLEGLAELLTERGFDVHHQPLIQTTTSDNDETIAQAKTLLICEWMLFTSQSAIDAWLELNLDFPKQMRYGAVGQKTAKQMKSLGVEVSVIGQPQDAGGLADVFIQNHSDAKSVALPKGNLSLSILDDRLSAAAIETKPLVIYETQVVEVDHLKDELFDVVFFASPSAVDAFQFLSKRKETAYVAIGETTAKAIRKFGQTCTIAQTPTVSVIAKAIVEQLEQDLRT